MTIPISVSLSGPSFSFLLFENSKCQFQQEGFLFGEILHKETKTITDNDQQQINISKTVRINSLLPCPQQHFFYNGMGKIDGNKIKDFLGDQFNKVVAWYKFQKISSLKFSLRDKIIHKQLIELFGISPDLFTCCFLSNEVSVNGSTHFFSQSFLRFHKNRYDHLPIYIPNLSESNNNYKTPESASFTFKKLLSELEIDRQTTQGFVIIIKIQKAVQNHIDNVIRDLTIEERQMYALEEEIKQLEIQKVRKKIDKEKGQLGDTLDNNLLKEDTFLKRKAENDVNNSFNSQISPDRNLSKKGKQKVTVKGRSGKDGRGSRPL